MSEYIDLVRVIGVSFVIALILGPIGIPLLRKLHVGQSIREEGPKSHVKKSGTPTMGGVIFLIAAIITSLISGIINKDLSLLIISTLGFGAIGFIDDFIKVVVKRNLGLKAYQKLLAQIFIALILVLYQTKISPQGTDIIIPFTNDFHMDLGIFYLPFIIFVVVGTVNSVNLTDGLDGLASGVTAIVLIFFSIIALNMNYGAVTVFSSALAGGCIGFLRYNSYPAKVFMGDTGSLALGGAVSAIAIILKLPLILPIVGAVYFAETLSVILQVISFKLTGKRIFKMSPLHHHFELSGWKETKVVAVFWSVTFLFCLMGLFSLKFYLG